MMMAKSSLDQRQVVYVNIDRLVLDKSNPRLFSSKKPTTQEQVFKLLWSEMAIDELVYSIAANGYWVEEPLFVIPEVRGQNPEDPNTKLVVIEGNRRLAAVILLRDQRLQERIKATKIPQLTKAQRQALEFLPVSVYKTRKELWAFLAFRHINSPQPWDAYSKASYVVQVHEDFGIAIETIANRIGDKHSTVSRFIRGYRVLQQAEDLGLFLQTDRATNRFYFSHLYAAVSYPEFQKFLSIEGKKPEMRNPVPKSKHGNLRELLVWLYGNKREQKPSLIASQNPDLNILREVISNPNSLDALRADVPLYRAHEIGIGDESRFKEAISRAIENLRQAKQSVTLGYKGESYIFETMQELFTLAESIKSEMERTLEKKKSRKPKQ